MVWLNPVGDGRDPPGLPCCAAAAGTESLLSLTHVGALATTFDEGEKALEISCSRLALRGSHLVAGEAEELCEGRGIDLRGLMIQARECEELKLALEESVRLRRKTEIDMRERHQRVVKEMQRKVEGGKQPGRARRPPSIPQLHCPRLSSRCCTDVAAQTRSMILLASCMPPLCCCSPLMGVVDGGSGSGRCGPRHTPQRARRHPGDGEPPGGAIPQDS
jgi:hypothetical protein